MANVDKVKKLMTKKQRSDKGGVHKRRGYTPGTKVTFSKGKMSSVATPKVGGRAPKFSQRLKDRK